MTVSFDESLTAVAKVDGGRILLAGGVLGKGSRSTYKATVVCYDYLDDAVVWQCDQTKRYPFTALVENDGVCAAMLPQNFTRCPTGLFRFDTKTGESLPTVEDRINSVAEGSNGFVYSFVEYPPDSESTSWIRVIDVDGNEVQRMTFPLSSSQMSRKIENVIWAGVNSFLLHFCECTNKVTHKVELWDTNSTDACWSKKVISGRVFRNDAHVVCWDSEKKKFKIELFSVETPSDHRSLKFRLPEVVAVQPIDSSNYLLATRSSLHLLNVDSSELTQVQNVDPGIFLDFVALAVDTMARKFVMANATAVQHAMHPRTHVTVIDF